MIITLLIFILLGVIFFSLGNIFLDLYTKYIDRDCSRLHYNILDILLLGLFVLTLLISAFSFFIPLNTHLLLIILIPCLIYFILGINNRKIVKPSFKHIPIFYFLVFAFIIFHVSFMIDTYDAKYYHLQQIESISRFPIIKGLANLEDRYGFNSNSFLLHSLFGLKSILGYYFFSLNPFLFFAVFAFLLKNISQKLSFFNIAALAVFVFIYLSVGHLLCSSNSDITSVIIAYYFIIRVIQQRADLQSIYLFVFLIPCVLLTVKLSSATFTLISLIPIYLLYKSKRYKAITSLLLISGLMLGIWLLRNVFISGYLIYPYPNIDLFNVDWKVPQTVAMIQKSYIRDFAYLVFDSNERVSLYKLKHFFVNKQYLDFGLLSIKSMFLIIIFITPVTLTRLFRRYNQNKLLIFIIFVLLGGFVFCFYQAPYLRFYLSFISCLILINLSTVKDLLKKANLVFTQSIRLSIVYLVILLFICASFINLKDNTRGLYQNKNAMILVKPQFDINSTRTHTQLKEETINNFVISINQDSISTEMHFTYDQYPTSSNTGIPTTNPAQGFKIQHLTTIEQRGSNITDGFRTKDEWKIFFKEKQDSIISEYKKGFKERFNL